MAGADLEAVREMALRCLDHRAYGTAELKARLLRKGADEATIDEVLARLTRVGLLDDTKYAASLVAEHHGVRQKSRQATALEMRRRGLDPEVIEAAVAGIDDADDLESARHLAGQKARRLAGLDKAVAWRRLSAALARKGYDVEVVSAVVREVL